MMTDEQAAMIAAATALQNSPLVQKTDKSTAELGDAISTLATQLYVDIRDWNDGREHDDIQDRPQGSDFGCDVDWHIGR